MTPTSSDVRILVDAQALRPGHAGPITGPISLWINGESFPIKNWSDFIVVVLTWWGHSLIRLVRQQSSLEKIPFMDGPFEVEVQARAPTTWQVRAYRRGRVHREQIFDAVCEPTALIESFVAASAAVLQACQERGFRSADISRLSISLLELSGFVPGRYE